MEGRTDIEAGFIRSTPRSRPKNTVEVDDIFSWKVSQVTV